MSSELLDTQVNPAVWEIGGHMVLKRKKDYEEASDNNAWRPLAEVFLSEKRFQEAKAYIFEAVAAHGAVEDRPTLKEDGEKADTRSRGPFNILPGKEECVVLQ